LELLPAFGLQKPKLPRVLVDGAVEALLIKAEEEETNGRSLSECGRPSPAAQVGGNSR